MPQHIRNQKQHVRTQEPETMVEKVTNAVNNAVNKASGGKIFRISTKQAMGTILTVILLIILVVLALHYFRIITLPLPVPQKPAPSSHLQYFFF